ncbi:MAG: hypothetical protein PVI06_17655 [Desulfobacterales bacterium]
MASAVSLTVLQSHLPEAVNGWKADPQDRIFDPTSIFSYINGAAEVYKAYNMRRCLSRRYSTTNGPPIVLDIFDMGSSEDAYGVFTHDTDGEVIEVGQDARLRPGWLSFWKHQFFVSIYMEEETTAAEIAVKKLGRLVAAQIPTTGTRPRILSKLPSTGLVFESIRYLHHPMVLNYHFYLSDENILNISAQTDAALADYRRGSGEAKLLLISYSDAEIAREALSRFFRHYLPDADKNGTALLENQKWSAAVLKDRLLAIVLESDSRELAESLLKTVSKKPA